MYLFEIEPFHLLKKGNTPFLSLYHFSPKGNCSVEFVRPKIRIHLQEDNKGESEGIFHMFLFSLLLFIQGWFDFNNRSVDNREPGLYSPEYFFHNPLVDLKILIICYEWIYLKGILILIDYSGCMRTNLCIPQGLHASRFCMTEYGQLTFLWEQRLYLLKCVMFQIMWTSLKSGAFSSRLATNVQTMIVAYA